MNVLLAMGIPTMTDDSGYFLWFSKHWVDGVVFGLAFGILLIAWVTRKIRSWARTHGSSNPPGGQSLTMELYDQPNPPSGPDQEGTPMPFELCFYP